MPNSERLTEAITPAFQGLNPVVDDALVERMVAALAPIVTPDFVCAMVAIDVTQEFEGPEGIKRAWSDWLEAYSELRFRIHGWEDVGENVLMPADQIGVTRHDGVEVVQPSAAVWKFRDGRLYRVEFHLDPRAAERSAQSVQE